MKKTMSTHCFPGTMIFMAANFHIELLQPGAVRFLRPSACDRALSHNLCLKGPIALQAMIGTWANHLTGTGIFNMFRFTSITSKN